MPGVNKDRVVDHPAMMLIKKQINEIEKEINIKMKNQNLKQVKRLQHVDYGIN